MRAQSMVSMAAQRETRVSMRPAHLLSTLDQVGQAVRGKEAS